VAKQRKSGATADADPNPQEQIFRAASVGMSITQDAAKEVGVFLVAAIDALEKNMRDRCRRPASAHE
jgi:hypothetical protein